jgi:SNF2 family DNA or RNA helicase
MTLHANWHESFLHVWGLADEADAHTVFSPGDLRAQVGEISSEPLLASAATESALTLLLPHPTGAGDWDLRPVRVATLRFSPADAIDLLASLPDERPACCAESFTFFARLATYVIDRLAHQQFFPDVVQRSDGSYEGTWRLLVGSEDELLRLQQFAASMPPSIRAVAADAATEPPDPVAIVDAFLGASADAIIRRDVSLDEFFASVATRAAEPGAPIEMRWVAALLAGDRTLQAEPGETAVFVEMLRPWIGKLDATGSATPMRLCFRLEEPEDEDEPALAIAADATADVDATVPALPDADADEVSGNGHADASPEAIAAADREREARERWTLRFEVQFMDDEGALVEADELWAQRAETPGLLNRNVLLRREQFRSELQRAAEIFPPLRAAVTQPEPTRVELSTLEAHAFIRQYGPTLEERGFGIFLPDWVTRRDLELGLLLSVAPPDLGTRGEDDDALDDAARAASGSRGAGFELSTGKFGLDSLLDFDWQIAVGDLRLNVRDLEGLMSRGSPLVRYRGKWLQIDPESAKRAIDFVANKRDGKMTLGQALRTAYGTSRADAGLPIIGLVGASWVDSLLNNSPDTKMVALEQPPELKGTLRPYQRRGLDWLGFLQRIGIGACLADDMGLGKTVQLIALLLHERHAVDAAIAAGKPTVKPGPTLLFAPTSVVGNWVRELQRFAPQLKVLVHHGPDRLAGDEFVHTAQASDVVVTTYALAHRDLEDLKRARWYRIALDEAQKIKNPSAASTISIRALEAPQRVALTGTPIENHLSELWSIMEVLNPGLLGTASEFRERFAVPIEKLQDAERSHQLRKLIQPFVLRRTKSDPTIAGDLPDKIETKVYCNLTAEQAALYQKVTTEMLGQIDTATGIRRRGLILAALTRLKQICDHPALIEKDRDSEPTAAQINARSGKCERLVEMLEELIEEGDAALIFTQYREMGHLLEKLIADRVKSPTLFLHGGTPSKKRDEMIQHFQDPKGDVRIFLLSLRAGGLGLNLTAANHVFHFDRWWNPAVESQATDRAYRIGQTRKVQVHKFVCVGTMEEKIDKLLTDKVALADRIVSTGDEWLTSMSTAELKEYLSLGREAVGEF